MYHSVTFGNKNSYTNWHLVPASQPDIALPDVKQNSVEIPGGNGSLDLSEALTKYPIYKNRSGSLVFHVLPDYYKTYSTIKSEIVSYLHGFRRTMYLEDDPNWIYNGRFSVTWGYTNDGTWPSVEIKYDLDPFKTKSALDTKTFSNVGTSGSSITITNNASNTTMPIIPELVLTSSGAGTIKVQIRNDELGIALGDKAITYGSVLNHNIKLHNAIVSNMSGSNTSIIKLIPNAGTITGRLEYRRALL